MAWITDHARVWRSIALVLLLVAIVGPWAYDQINVPAEYPCSAPFVRLEGDFCGMPVSGAYMLFALGSESINIISGLVTGRLIFAETSRQILIIFLGYLLLLPTVSTLLMILKGNRHWLQIFHLVVLSLAGCLMLWAFLAESGLRITQLWGPWLYTGVIFSVLILEVLVFAQRRVSDRAR